jgi:5-formyltetrahydrofolate cyclo-ligase
VLDVTNRAEHPKDVVPAKMSDTEMSDKAAVRRAVVAARRALAPAVRDQEDAALVRHAVAAAHGLRRVAAYAPMAGEPGGPALVPALAAVVLELVLPVLLPDRDLDWAVFEHPLGPAGPGGFQAPDGPRLGPDAIADAQLIIVPAVAVDPTGRRLGRGGGCYDRALARVRPGVPVLALLYESELVDEVPAEPHDQPVNAVLLPGGRQSCGSPPKPS